MLLSVSPIVLVTERLRFEERLFEGWAACGMVVGGIVVVSSRLDIGWPLVAEDGVSHAIVWRHGHHYSVFAARKHHGRSARHL